MFQLGSDLAVACSGGTVAATDATAGRAATGAVLEARGVTEGGTALPAGGDGPSLGNSVARRSANAGADQASNNAMHPPPTLPTAGTAMPPL